MAGLNTLMKSEYRDLLVTSVVSTEKKYRNKLLNNQHSFSTVVFFCFFYRYNSGMSVNSVYACVNVARHIVLVCDNIIY